MLAYTPEFLVLILGVTAAIAAALQHVSEMLTKGRIFKTIFCAGLIIQLLTQYVQYWNASTNLLKGRKEVERNAAISLYGYTENDVPLLKLLSVDDYIIGYRLYRNQKYEEAKDYFKLAIDKKKYVAPSHYMLAHISRTQAPTGSDITEAVNHLENAIAYDDKYGSPYYARAITKLAGNQKTAALNDLEIATGLGKVYCYDFTDPKEVRSVWATLETDSLLASRFKDLQSKCRAELGPGVVR